jgi:F0F1-type ATP synthase membrane subunit b/b'
VAEVLIAAAGAAAAVLLSGKADAVVEAGQTAVDQAKKTSKKTLDAANKAMSTAKKHASNIVEAAAAGIRLKTRAYSARSRRKGIGNEEAGRRSIRNLSSIRPASYP